MNENTKRFADPAVLEKIKAIESLPKHRQKLEQIKKEMGKNATQHTIWMVAIIVGSLYLLSIAKEAIFAIIPIAFFVMPRLEKFQKANNLSYVDNFLLPVLQEALPNVKVDYYSGIDLSVLKQATPDSSRYNRNCHIVFADEMQTEFCNLHSYHEEYDKDHEKHSITDFNGQILLAKCKTNLKGRIRIVPTTKGFLGSEVQEGYDYKAKDEVQIETEDILFNEKYNVYCADELSARMLLNPYMIAVLDEWSLKMPVAVYMNEDTVVLSFYSSRQILQVPSSGRAIEKLSLSGEYEKIQNELTRLYCLLDTLNHQI